MSTEVLVTMIGTHDLNVKGNFSLLQQDPDFAPILPYITPEVSSGTSIVIFKYNESQAGIDSDLVEETIDEYYKPSNDYLSRFNTHLNDEAIPNVKQLQMFVGRKFEKLLELLDTPLTKKSTADDDYHKIRRLLLSTNLDHMYNFDLITKKMNDDTSQYSKQRYKLYNDLIKSILLFKNVYNKYNNYSAYSYQDLFDIENNSDDNLKIKIDEKLIEIYKNEFSGKNWEREMEQLFIPKPGKRKLFSKFRRWYSERTFRKGINEKLRKKQAAEKAQLKKEQQKQAKQAKGGSRKRINPGKIRSKKNRNHKSKKLNYAKNKINLKTKKI